MTGMIAGAGVLRSKNPLEPRGCARTGDFRIEFFSDRFEPTRLRLTNFGESGRNRAETHHFRRPPTTASSPARCCASRKGSRSPSTVYNDTDTPEQLHWHGQMVPTDVDGAAEEGTPFIPAHGKRRHRVHSESRRLAFLSHAQSRRRRSGRRTIQRPSWPGVHRAESTSRADYDREVFLVLKEFEPTLQPRRRHGAGFSFARNARESAGRSRASPP